MGERKLFEYTDKNLEADDNFESNIYEVPQHQDICGKVFADQSGTLQILESDDGDIFDITDESEVNADSVLSYDYELHCNYVKVKYINDSVNQEEFRLSIYFD